MTLYPVKQAYDDAMAQLHEYRLRRAENPAHFGNDLFGCWDGTPEKGPAPLICHSGAVGAPAGLFWQVHKHRWPLDYIYCFGKAWDSRGERTDPLLTIDIRDLPKQFVGRFKLQITSANCHHRKAHRAVLGRAFAAGFDFAAHAKAEERREEKLAAERKQKFEQFEIERDALRQALANGGPHGPDRIGACSLCGCTAPLLSNGTCLPCDDSIPF